MAEQPVVVVRGEAFREVPPELAVFSVTVSVRDPDRQVALTRLTERAAELRSALDDYPEAIEKRETGGIDAHPDLRGRRDRIVAYTASMSTTVTVTDFAVLGELLLRLAAMEQTAVSGPWWQLRPGSRAGADIRRAAIEDALARARDYAEAVGARPERLIEILDEGTGGGHGMMRAVNLGFDQSGDQTLDVDPQPQTVQATVVLRIAITEPAVFTA